MKGLIIFIMTLLPMLARGERITLDGYVFTYNESYNENIRIVGVTGSELRKIRMEKHLRIPDQFTVDGVVYPVTSLADSVFFHKNLVEVKEITLPQNLWFCGRDNFCDMPAVEKINLGNALSDPGNRNFSNMPLLKSVELPLSIIVIGYGCFSNTGITSLTIPEKCIRICSGFQGGGATFWDMPDLTELNLGNIEKIMDHAFVDLPLLKTITIPHTCTDIWMEAFMNLASLTEVRFEKREDAKLRICKDLFADCPLLKDVYVEDAVPFPISEGYGVLYEREPFEPANCTLHVPAGAKDAYAEAPYWSRFGTIVEEGAAVEEIAADGDSDDAVEYYNLQGMRVENPAAGIYLCRKGSKVSKVILH